MAPIFPRAQLTVGGRGLTVHEASATSGYRSPFATLTARVLHTQGGFRGDEAVRLDLGYLAQASMRAVGAGKLREDSIRYAPKQVAFSAVGPLGRTQEATGIEDTSLANPDPTLPPSTERFAKGWVNATDGQIVTDILALYGITDVTIADSGQRFATLAPSPGSKYAVRLRSDEPGWTLIQEIDKLTGYRTFDGPDGRVTRIAASGLPSGSAARTFTQGLDFKGSDATRTRSSEGVYNRVTCKGQSGILGDGTPYAIAVTVSAPSPYVPTPPGFRELVIESDLIETYDLANAIATRTLGEVNRRVETVTLPLTKGDSGLYAGMTVAVVAPALDLTGANLYRIVETQHGYGGQGYQTTITLQGGAASAGTDPNQPPLAAIDYELEIEGLASGAEIVVAALDGSGSHDPDGTIATYAWSGVPVSPTPIGAGVVASAVYNPFPATPPTVTLTVTDDHGRPGSATRTITRAAGKVYTRDLWYCDGTLHFSPDQKVWRDYPVAAVVIPEQAGDEYILCASAGGALARILKDGTATAPGGPVGVTALTISRDRTGAETGVAWAAAGDGRVWRSVDKGVSWAAVAPLPNDGRCNAIEESPYSPGDLYAGGGNVLWHSYGAGASWEAFHTHPNAALTVARFASGVAAGADASVGKPVGWIGYGGPVGAAGEVARVVERGGTLVHPLPGGQPLPLSVTALTISLDAERLFVADDGDGGRAFTASAGVSGDLVPKAAYDRTALGAPRHAIRDGRFPIIWGASQAGVWKSTDEGGSFLLVKSAPGATMVAYGALVPFGTVAVTGDLLWVAATIDGNGRYGGAVVNALTASGFARRAGAPAFPIPGAPTMIPLRQVAPGVLLAFAVARFGGGKPGPSGAANCLRSTDGGATWAAIAVPYVSWVATDGQGGCYALAWATDGTQTGAGAGLYRSTDAGASWTFAIRFDGTSNSGPRAQHVIASPTNPLHVLVRQTYGGAQGTAYHLSVDGGATFVPAIAVYDENAVQGGITGAYSPDGTFVVARDETGGPSPLRRSPEAGPAGGTALAAAEAQGIGGFAALGPALVAYGAGAFLSTDGAASFAPILGDAGVNLRYAGFVPGDAGNAWYALNATGIVRQDATANPTPSGWAAIPPATLSAAFPDGVYGCVPAGAVRLTP